jgi:CRISPR locus-related DNA-binding protein
MTTFVSTLGFDTSHLHSLLVDEDVEDDDHLLLIRPDDEDNRGENAVQEVEGTVDMIDVELTTEVEKFDPEDFEGTTKRLVDRLDGMDDGAVISLAGGDRALVVALSVAVMTTTTEVRSTHVRSDVTRESNEVALPTVRPSLNDRDREVLKYIIENGPVSNTRIASMTDMSEPTVSRSRENLEERGYIQVENNGGANSMSATFLGELISGRL